MRDVTQLPTDYQMGIAPGASEDLHTIATLRWLRAQVVSAERNQTKVTYAYQRALGAHQDANNKALEARRMWDYWVARLDPDKVDMVLDTLDI